jgi:hypothetical protein
MVFEDDKISCPIPDAPSTCLLIANEGETRADRVKCKISLTTPLVEARSFCFDSYTADSCLSRLKGLRCASDGILRITDVSFFGKLWRCLCLSTPSYYPVRYSAIRGAITRQLDEEGNCYSGDILVSLGLCPPDSNVLPLHHNPVFGCKRGDSEPDFAEAWM